MQATGEQAVELTRRGRYSQALPLWEQLHQWQVRHLGERDPRSMRTLQNLGGLYLGTGFPQKAADVYRQHLALVEVVSGHESAETASACFNLAKAERTLGRFDAAETLTQRALRLLQALPPTAGIKAQMAQGHELLGTIAHERGLYPLAEGEHRKALRLRQELNEPQSLNIANSTANLAQALMRQGRFAQGLDLQLQALTLYRNRPGLESRGQQSTVLSNIALLQDLLGNRPAALAAMREALPLRVQISGADHPETARLMLNLGALEAAEGALGEALNHYRQGLRVLEQRMGAQHISTAFAVQRMAELARDVGQIRNAINWYERALRIRRRELRAAHPDIATTLLGLALAHLQNDKPDQATPQLAEALAIRRQAFGDRHPYTALTTLLLALVQWEAGQAGDAVGLFQAATAAYTNFLQGEAALLPIQERRRLLTTIEESRNVLYGLALQSSTGLELALDARLNLQGLLEELERRQTLLLRQSPESRGDLAALTSLTNQLSRMELEDGERQRLMRRRDALERRLFQQLETVTGPRGPVSRAEIAAALPRQGVLVEFVRFEPVQFRRGELSSSGVSRYAALILQPDQRIAAVDLGPADALHRAIWEALKRTQRGDLEAAAAWEGVSDLVLKPLLPQLRTHRQWFFSPDGELHRIPFAALGTSANGVLQPYGDQHQIRLLTSARELLLSSSGARQTTKPLVLADPDFDVSPDVRKPAENQPTEGGHGTDQWRSLRWSRLPGSRSEGIAIQQLIHADLHTDRAAQTTRISAAQSPRLLHVASHGAFLPRPHAGKHDSSKRLKALEGKADQASDPMLRGVVLLAGANRISTDQDDDGLLTALELSRMDLQGTDLVTLSACDTGIGAIEIGDGIYGLRRGIAVAGAKSSLLSLWKVSDEATNALMQAFYTELGHGKTPETSLKLAQQHLRQHPNKTWHHPYYWAAFQLYGRSW